MTKREIRQIETARYHAARALDYIKSPRVAVCLVDKVATTTLHFSRADGRVLYEVAKEIGSDLCGLSDAVSALDSILATANGKGVA